MTGSARPPGDGGGGRLPASRCRPGREQGGGQGCREGRPLRGGAPGQGRGGVGRGTVPTGCLRRADSDQAPSRVPSAPPHSCPNSRGPRPPADPPHTKWGEPDSRGSAREGARAVGGLEPAPPGERPPPEGQPGEDRRAGRQERGRGVPRLGRWAWPEGGGGATRGGGRCESREAEGGSREEAGQGKGAGSKGRRREVGWAGRRRARRCVGKRRVPRCGEGGRVRR